MKIPRDPKRLAHFSRYNFVRLYFIAFFIFSVSLANAQQDHARANNSNDEYVVPYSKGSQNPFSCPRESYLKAAFSDKAIGNKSKSMTEAVGNCAVCVIAPQKAAYDQLKELGLNLMFKKSENACEKQKPQKAFPQKTLKEFEDGLNKNLPFVKSKNQRVPSGFLSTCIESYLNKRGLSSADSDVQEASRKLIADYYQSMMRLSWAQQANIEAVGNLNLVLGEDERVQGKGRGQKRVRHKLSATDDTEDFQDELLPDVKDRTNAIASCSMTPEQRSGILFKQTSASLNAMKTLPSLDYAIRVIGNPTLNSCGGNTPPRFADEEIEQLNGAMDWPKAVPGTPSFNDEGSNYSPVKLTDDDRKKVKAMQSQMMANTLSPPYIRAPKEQCENYEKIRNEKLKDLLKARHAILQSNPWLKGDVFQDKLKKMNSVPDALTDLTPSKASALNSTNEALRKSVQGAMLAQLKQDKENLKIKGKKIVKAAQCLNGKDSGGGGFSCDPSFLSESDLGKILQEVPPSALSGLKTDKDETKNGLVDYLSYTACYTQNRNSRAELSKAIDINVALLGITAAASLIPGGQGAAVAQANNVKNAVSAAMLVQRTMTAMDLFWLGHGAVSAYKECNDSLHQSYIEGASKYASNSAPMCSNLENGANLSSRADYGSCLTSIAVNSLNILPFAGKLAGKLVQSTKREFPRASDGPGVHSFEQRPVEVGTKANSKSEVAKPITSEKGGVATASKVSPSKAVEASRAKLIASAEDFLANHPKKDLIIKKLREASPEAVQKIDLIVELKGWKEICR